jgi:endonuclease YncB( thermonuclease family)
MRALLGRIIASNGPTVVPCSTVAAENQGEVIRIMDGDTIEGLHNSKAERIRLSGIDCPEKGQAFGKRVKQATSALVFGKDVNLQTHGQDKYKRTLADVILPDGTNVNHELVKQGWCWWYRKYVPQDAEIEKRETRRKACGSIRLPSHRGSIEK